MTQSLRTSYCEKIPRDRMQMLPLSQATHLHSLIILFPFNTNGHFVMISTGPTDPKKTTYLVHQQLYLCGIPQ